jgi:hypothetical protein
MKFGYAVDASWEPPTVEPVTDVWTDFPETANALEPFVLSVWMYDPLYALHNDMVDLRVTIVDRQGTALPFSQLEAPDILDGAIYSDTFLFGETGYLWNEITRGFLFQNEKDVLPGTYFGLVKMKDEEQDAWLGDINHLYSLIEIEALDPAAVPHGTVVFKAPGPPDPGGDGAINIFTLDLETEVETQISGYIGVGILLGEGRINPTGTHVLWDAGPSPYYSNILVHEIGGSTWIASPGDIYDGSADFHPDGEHILVAAGPQAGETTELYTMKYDGTERTLLATAPGCVRNPKWSPDGTRIVMSLGVPSSDPPHSSLYMYTVSTGIFEEIVPAPGLDENPSWSPVQIGGHYLIAFDSTRWDIYQYDHHIFILNPDVPTTVDEIDAGDGKSLLHPTWSPDGNYLIFDMSDGSDEELYMYSFGTGEMTQVTDDDSYDGGASWCWGW